MVKINVKVFCPWDSDLNIKSIFEEIWLTERLRKIINLTHGDDYDYLIILNGYKSHKPFNCPIENRISFIMEPSWSPNWDRNLGSYVSKIYSHFQFHPKCVFNPSVMSTHLFPKPINIGEIQAVPDLIKSISKQKFEKTKKLSIVVSSINHYKRFKFVESLLDSDLEFDMFGKGWNISDSRYKGYLESKLDAFRDYEYSICLENSNEYGYISEKFIDSILCETIPIYYGSNDVERWYGNCFEYINVESEDPVNKIKSILDSGKPNYDFTQAKNFYLEINNPFNILLNYIQT